MALILYSNGIIESITPDENSFTDEEFASVFEGYEYVVSSRLLDVANTWCLWGVMKSPDDNEYNKIGTEIVEEEIYSHLLLIHDSEINPSWDITDSILYKSYNEYTVELGDFINSIVLELHKMNEEESDETQKNFIKLAAIGQTPDKRVIFDFDTDSQSPEFFKTEFPIFAARIKDYLSDNFETDTSEDVPLDNLIIFADNKTIVVVKKEKANGFLSMMIELYVSTEEYEIASYIKSIQLKWDDYSKNKIEDTDQGDVSTEKEEKDN